MGRLRLLIGILLGLGAVGAAVAALITALQPQLAVPPVVLVLVTAIVVLWPTLQGFLKQRLESFQKQDQKDEDKAKQLAERARKDVLEQVRRAWVQPELRGSLYEQARIELGLAERPAAVENPLRAVLRRPDEPDHLLEPGRPIAEVYRQLGRQLLILGEPGGGKTTLLMELTDQLLDEAEPAADQPMPMVFHLSTWAVERRPLAAWLVDELYKRYGVPRRLGQMWVDSDQVTPLLDGLDEVTIEHRDACAAAINTFHDDHGLTPLVVCSRITEYGALQAKLRLRGAIVIQPLDPIDVDRYLRQVGGPLAGVQAAVHEDQRLAELLTTPLFLSIVALTYSGRPAAVMRASGTVVERRQRVLGDYITAMLTRPQPSAAPPPYTPQQTLLWLAWLAAAMSAHSQSVFYLDWMQPDWLRTQMQRRLVTVGSAVVAGLGFLLVSGLGYGLVSGLVSGLVMGYGLSGGLGYGLVSGLLLGLPTGLMVGLFSYDPTITPTERLRWTTASLRRNFRRLFVRAAAGGLGISLIFWLAIGGRSGYDLGLGPGLGPWLVSGLIIGLFFGLPTGLIIGLLFGLLSGLQAQSYVTPPSPGKAVQVSKRNALRSGLPIGLGVGLILGLGFGLLAGPTNDLPTGLAAGLAGLFVGLGVGSVVGLQRGGGAYLRHHLLRWRLVRNRSIPQRYVAFLDYATRLILLRRRGGGYEFVHRLLLEHFAALEPRSWHAQGSLSEGPSVDQQPAFVVPEPNHEPPSGISG